MKKSLIITQVDGTVISEDLTHKRGLPLGAPANDVSYVNMALEIARVGWIAKETNKDHVVVVAPSQIKKVEIKFTK